MELAACHSRRPWEADPRVYFCAHPRVLANNNLVSPMVCRICDYWRQPPPEEFRTIPPPPGVVRSGPCAHLGDQIALRACATCGGSVQLKVFACRHPEHAETTWEQCQRCPDYLAPAASLPFPVHDDPPSDRMHSPEARG